MSQPTDKLSIITNRIGQCLSAKILSTDYNAVGALIKKFFHKGDWTKRARDDLYRMAEPYFPIVRFHIDTITDLTTITSSSTVEGMVKIKDYIARGSSGQIWTAEIDGVESIVKMPLSEWQIQSEIFMEVVLLILLECSKSKIMQEIPEISGFIWPFPKLRFAANAKFSGDYVGIITGMQKFDKTLGDAIEEGIITFADLIDIFVQVTVYLYRLQKIIGFCHRDLYCGNIMLTALNSPTLRTYKNMGITIATISRYNVHIIDLGQSCIDFNLCKECDLPYIIAGSQISYTNNANLDGCFNYCNDLRLFVGATMSSIRDFCPLLYTMDQLNILTEFYKMAFTEVLGDGVNAELDSFDICDDWFKLYDYPESEVDQRFIPRTFFKKLRSIIHMDNIFDSSDAIATFKDHDSNRRMVANGDNSIIFL